MANHGAWIRTLVSVVVVCLVSLVGLVTVFSRPGRAKRTATILVSFAVGALLGDAFIHLVPETFTAGRALRGSLLILGGMLLFFVVEKLLRHRHHGTSGEVSHERLGGSPLAMVNLLGDAIHNFIDGALIAASYLVSPALGLSTTVAVLLHEIPQELADFAVFLHGGISVRRAVASNLATASLAIVGAIAALLIGSAAGSVVAGVLVPVTAGGFVYIAAADLIPELHHDRTVRGLLHQAGLITLGIMVMAGLSLLE